MASFAGNLHRPLSAMAAITAAAMSTDIFEKFSDHKPAEDKFVTSVYSSNSNVSKRAESCSWATRVSVPDLPRLALLSREFKPLSGCQFPNSNFSRVADCQSIAPPPAYLTPYQYAKFSKPTTQIEAIPPVSSSPSEVMYRWHLPQPSAYLASDKSDCSSTKSRTVVVLLGWLGAKQKHLKRYSEWYTSMGFHAVTFTFPMSDVMSYRTGGKAEQNLELLASHLAGWVAEEHGKNLVFHTFSNTGWLMYGALIEKFRNQDPSLLGSIKGCIVDSAPVAAPDPQVWASGFSAAFLKKQSVATKGARRTHDQHVGQQAGEDSNADYKPAVAETALLAALELFFGVVLNLPAINRRLSEVLDVLSLEQPKCPQLYVYSSADRVIPVKSVEAFIEAQRRAGHEVRACDFISSPHVDHFRNHPGLYTTQLTTFLDDCVLGGCKDSS